MKIFSLVLLAVFAVPAPQIARVTLAHEECTPELIKNWKLSRAFYVDEEVDAIIQNLCDLDDVR